MRIFIFVAVTLVLITAQAWTAELTDSNSGSRECQDLPYTDEAGDIIKTPDDFITEVETTDPNPIVDHDPGEITITYHNDQNGVSQIDFFRHIGLVSNMWMMKIKAGCNYVRLSAAGINEGSNLMAGGVLS